MSYTDAPYWFDASSTSELTFLLASLDETADLFGLMYHKWQAIRSTSQTLFLCGFMGVLVKHLVKGFPLKFAIKNVWSTANPPHHGTHLTTYKEDHTPTDLREEADVQMSLPASASLLILQC